MSRYTVKGTTILHNGKVYAEGSTIELDDKHAEQLAAYLEVAQGNNNTQRNKNNSGRSNNKKRFNRSGQSTRNNTPSPAPVKQENTANIPTEKKDEQAQEKQEKVAEQPKKETTPETPENFVPPNMRRS